MDGLSYCNNTWINSVNIIYLITELKVTIDGILKPNKVRFAVEPTNLLFIIHVYYEFYVQSFIHNTDINLKIFVTVSAFPG